MKIIAKNKTARRNYEILEKFEAGIELLGQEVKSIKKGRINLRGSYVILRAEEVFLINANIAPYQVKNTPLSYNPSRPRKLLLHKKEIRYLIGKTREKGLTLTPLLVYTKHGKVKLSFALAKGRKKFDKRELIKKREIKRTIERFFKRG